MGRRMTSGRRFLSQWAFWEVWDPKFEKWVLGKELVFMVLGSLFGVKNHEIETRKSDKTPNASPKHSCCSRHVFWESASGLGKVHIATNAPIFSENGVFHLCIVFLTTYGTIKKHKMGPKPISGFWRAQMAPSIFEDQRRPGTCVV